MLGLSESEILKAIDTMVARTSITSETTHIKDQEVLDPNDILRKLAIGVASAIAKNNQAIEKELEYGTNKL
jgi:hypothetical protein